MILITTATRVFAFHKHPGHMRIAFVPIRPMLGRRPHRSLDPRQRRRAIVALSCAIFGLALLRFRKVTAAAM